MRQGDGAPLTGRRRSIVPFRSRAEHDDLCRRQCMAVDVYLLTRMGDECYAEQLRIGRGIRDPGQSFLGALERKLIELDRREIRAKVAAPGDYALRLHVAESRVIGIEVGECANSARGHAHLGQPEWSRSLIAPASTQG